MVLNFKMVVGDGLPSLRSRTSLRAVEPDVSTPCCFTACTAFAVISTTLAKKKHPVEVHCF
ncbi:MAG: hypothetical protein J6R00_12345 [Lentisphaeria bacterium]|nr:hypothetical protein [Lentisphaeria bacterium]